ncbi:MAG: bifunctional 4-hydroxy-3-methylbut-2-enyl diphosphate reductase/30S ribosomal protein S1 [Clostridia bacterium]|nr:bifunctional 4-hydroxy-3-methylbut-2-enyl diphosphate reductase/30S ribosomal protein S1 [Clostridia bacterium]
MSIKLAKTAGFCFGVDRAVKTVYSLVEEGRKVCTLGPIIHNPQVVEDLASKGVVIINSPEEADEDSCIVIRSHGVSDKVINNIKEHGREYVDATCPFVKNIHKLVREAGDKVVIVAGDEHHPEVQGITGCAVGECYVIYDAEELEKLLNSHPDFSEKEILLCAQTTFNVKKWEKCEKILKNHYTKALIFDTICNATAKRQAEASSLAKENDVMIVVGGRESSNTRKLKDVCSEHARTYLIETAEELKDIPEVWEGVNLGITAGASTPASIIKEVFDTMAENFEKELSFAELLEQEDMSYNTNGVVHAVVIEVNKTEVTVDIGRKQTGYISADEFSSDPNLDLTTAVAAGDEFDVLIMKTNDADGVIACSKKRIDARKGWDVLAKAEEEKTVLTAKVTEVVKGGVIVVVEGVRVFIPASLATENRADSLEDLKGQEVSFRITEVQANRRRAIGSIRAVLREQKKALAEKFWETVEENQVFTGKVKSITNFGAFVDLGGVDGMIHISELSWNRIKHPSEVVSVGDEVTVYIKSLDRENGKISLGYKKDEDNPWAILERDYPVGTVCDATIVSLTTFGAFARVIPGIDGLIHISQIADRRIEKPEDVLTKGQVVTVKITDIDFEDQRVSLSIRALLENAEEAEEAPVAEEE